MGHDNCSPLDDFGNDLRSVPSGYRGICVGGPYDGKFATCAYPFMPVADLSPASKVIGNEIKVTVNAFSYEFVDLSTKCRPGTRGMPRKFGFWVPHGKDAGWAMDRLIHTFVENGGSVDPEGVADKK